MLCLPPGFKTRTCADRPSSCRRWLSSRTLVLARSTDRAAVPGDAGVSDQATECRAPAVDAAGLWLPDCRVSRRPAGPAIARYSDAIATHSSVSAITAGLHAIGSRSTAKPSARPDRERVEAVEVIQAALERLLERRALAHAPGQIPGRDLGVVVGLEVDPLALRACAAGGCGSTASRCGPGRGRGRWRTGASARSSRGSRSPSACDRARGCRRSQRARNARRTPTADPPPCRSRSCVPALISVSSGWLCAQPRLHLSASAEITNIACVARTPVSARFAERRLELGGQRIPVRGRASASAATPCTSPPAPGRGRTPRRRCRARERTAARACRDARAELRPHVSVVFAYSPAMPHMYGQVGVAEVASNGVTGAQLQRGLWWSHHSSSVSATPARPVQCARAGARA